MPQTAISRLEGPPHVARRTRTLHAYDINGLALMAYDEEGSLSADRVAGELLEDTYGFERIPFEADDLVIDIGAHVGLVSMYLARRWPFLRIHAFEPHPTNYENCVDNLRVNRVSNVHLSQRAVTADRRAVVLRHLPCNTGGATAVFDMPGAQCAAAVDSVTLDDIFDRTLAPGQRCRLLKIDCEGMEYEILPSPVLDRVDFLAAEFHDDALGGEDQRSVDTRGAQALGERCARFLQPDRLRVICCPKQD